MTQHLPNNKSEKRTAGREGSRDTEVGRLVSEADPG